MLKVGLNGIFRLGDGFEAESRDLTHFFLFLKMGDEVLDYANENLKSRKREERSSYLIFKYHPLNEFMHTYPRFRDLVAEHKEIYEQNLRKYGDGEKLLNKL